MLIQLAVGIRHAPQLGEDIELVRIGQRIINRRDKSVQRHGFVRTPRRRLEQGATDHELQTALTELVRELSSRDLHEASRETDALGKWVQDKGETPMPEVGALLVERAFVAERYGDYRPRGALCEPTCREAVLSW